MTDTLVLHPRSPAEARQIDQTCDRFETAWKAGRRPDLAQFLAAVGDPVRSALLKQLLLLDWDYRRRAGDEPRVGDYLPAFPSEAAVIEAVAREMSEAPVSTEVGLQTTSAGDVPVDAPEQVGPDAERYDLRTEIGRGGIGIVYRGHDRFLGRDLAVKVLRDDYRDRPDARRRFVAEARVGSQLQHPAIVPVYESGRFADGRPYITMKLVEGHTLAALLRDRNDPGQDLPRWIGVFEQVCQAMAYAHNNGIIHRDLKPANVMVGAFGEVQVMDWGFAKHFRCAGPTADLGDTGPTGRASPSDTNTAVGNGAPVSQSGALMGTPAYMSPEQARGGASPIGPRADVFALGAILCEILTGRPPYTGSSAEAVYQSAAAADLADAHARLDACGADAPLRDLAKQCLATDSTTRPADAGMVAQAVTAYLASSQERLRRAEVERGAAVARADSERRARRLALALAAALLVGAGLAGWQAVVATRAKQTAVAAAVGETAAKESAQSKEAETRAVLNFVEEKVFAAARPIGEAGGLGSTVTLRQALEAALKVVDQGFAKQPLTEARLRVSLGHSFYYLGEAQISADQYQRALAIYLEHVGPEHADTLSCMDKLANSYDSLGRSADAVTLREEALAGQKVTLGPNHPDTCASMNNLGVSYHALGRYADALRIWEETLAVRKATLGPNHPDTINSMSNLTLIYAVQGRHQDALKLCEETLVLRKSTLPAGSPAIIENMLNLANCYDDLDRFDDALKLREETLPLMRSSLPPSHPTILWGMHNLANSYSKLDRHPEALALRQETLNLREAKLGPNHPDTLRSLRSLAESLVRLDRGAEAVKYIDECVRRSAGQVVHPKLIPGVMNLRLRYFESAKDAAGCRATAQMWEDLHRPDADSLYMAASFRAVTAKLLRLTAADEALEADRAIAWLKAAAAAGFKDGAKVMKDRDFDDLRDRPEFQALAKVWNAGS